MDLNMENPAVSFWLRCRSLLQGINPFFLILFCTVTASCMPKFAGKFHQKSIQQKRQSCFSLINCNLATCRTRRRNCINTSAFNVLVALTVRAKTWRAILVCFARVECSHNKLSSFVLNCWDEEHAGLMGLFVYSFLLLDRLEWFCICCKTFCRFYNRAAFFHLQRKRGKRANAAYFA